MDLLLLTLKLWYTARFLVYWDFCGTQYEIYSQLPELASYVVSYISDLAVSPATRSAKRRHLPRLDINGIASNGTLQVCIVIKCSTKLLVSALWQVILRRCALNSLILLIWVITEFSLVVLSVLRGTSSWLFYRLWLCQIVLCTLLRCQAEMDPISYIH